MTLGERIAWHRTLMGYSQAELARRAGISRQCLYEYETNRTDPKLFNAACIADALGISLDYLAKGTVRKC